MNNNLDKLFKKALQDRSCEPPPHIWGNIERELDRQRNRNRMAWWLRGTAAMAVIGMAWWFLLQETKGRTEMQWVNVTPPSVQLKENSHFLAQADERHEKNIMPEIQPDGVGMVSIPSRQEPPCPEFAVPTRMAPGLVPTLPVADVKTPPVRTEIIPIVNGQALKNIQEYNKMLERESFKEKEKEKEKKDLKIFLSGHVAPVYTSGNYNSSAINTRGYSYSKSQMNGTVNASGGLKLSVATGKRLAVQTGVFYSRMGQHTQENESRPLAAAFTSGNSPDYNYIVTPLGNLKSRTKGVSYRSAEAVALSKSNNQLEGIEQTFNMVEIPLSLRYRLYENKFSLSVSGGLSGNIIVDNKTYMIYGDRKEYMGSTEDIRRFNLSTDIGLGVEYPLSRNIKIMLEPGFKYYVQSLSRNSQIDFKPYVFSLSTGIGIEF